MAKKYLRKLAVRQRYGNVSTTTVERMVKDGRLPSPVYFGNNCIPYWDEEALDENDRAATLRPRARAAS